MLFLFSKSISGIEAVLLVFCFVLFSFFFPYFWLQCICRLRKLLSHPENSLEFRKLLFHILLSVESIDCCPISRASTTFRSRSFVCSYKLFIFNQVYIFLLHPRLFFFLSRYQIYSTESLTFNIVYLVWLCSALHCSFAVSSIFLMRIRSVVSGIL